MSELMRHDNERRSTIRTAAVLAASLAAAACGQSQPAVPPGMPGAPGMPAMPGVPGTPAMPTMPAMPTTPAMPAMPAAPPTLTVGGPAQGVEVPAPPGFTVTLMEAGEYQIDAMAAPMDVELYVYSGDTLAASDRDSGEGSDARIVDFLAPGTYSLRVFEYQARPMSARVQVQKLPALTPVGALTPGQPLAVQVSQAQDIRTACREVTLTITAPGSYQITAVGDGEVDPEIALIQNAARLEHDDDSGGNRSSRIQRALTPGQYTLRVWDHGRRAGTITVAATPG